MRAAGAAACGCAVQRADPDPGKRVCVRGGTDWQAPAGVRRFEEWYEL